MGEKEEKNDDGIVKHTLKDSVFTSLFKEKKVFDAAVPGFASRGYRSHRKGFT